MKKYRNFIKKRNLQLRSFFLMILDLIPRSFNKSSSVMWDRQAPSMVADSIYFGGCLVNDM